MDYSGLKGALRKSHKITKYLSLITPFNPLFFFITFLFLCLGCFNRTRFNNFNWQLDSLKYYTTKFDSLLNQISKELAQLRTDYYTKSEELAEKIEMLNTRLGESEAQLTQIIERLSRGKKVASDSEDVSSISPEARMIYESAYLNYVKGNYPEAINGFKSYLKVAPESPISDNALYWIGECYYSLGKRQDAVDTFNELLNKYPQSNKRPTALYKIGIIYEEAKDKKTARTYFERVIKEFPNAPESALAKERLNK
uniref:Tol-pal system protein YbgF n=1 Tax=candidate division WOR-3 bacterium TaxID=2052148 RepID=A0A7C4TEX1_UNCW3